MIIKHICYKNLLTKNFNKIKINFEINQTHLYNKSMTKVAKLPNINLIAK